MLATVAWQLVGLVGNVALVWVIARVAPSLVAGVAVQKVALPLLAAGIVLLAVPRALLRARPAAGHQGRHALCWSQDAA